MALNIFNWMLLLFFYIGIFCVIEVEIFAGFLYCNAGVSITFGSVFFFPPGFSLPLSGSTYKQWK